MNHGSSYWLAVGLFQAQAISPRWWLSIATITLVGLKLNVANSEVKKPGIQGLEFVGNWIAGIADTDASSLRIRNFI